MRTGDSIKSCIAEVFDDFMRVDAKPGFWYRRHTAPLYAFIVIQHSSKYRCFEVDVVSTVFSSWDRQYGTHQLRRATGLPNLREGSGSMLLEDVPYEYDDAPAEALAVISNELRRFAEPWLAAHRRELDSDPLVKHGCELIQDDSASRVALDELKQKLRKEADRVGATKWQRRETAILALDLIRCRDETQLTSRCS